MVSNFLQRTRDDIVPSLHAEQMDGTIFFKFNSYCAINMSEGGGVVPCAHDGLFWLVLRPWFLPGENNTRTLLG